MPEVAARRCVHATVAHRKLSGKVLTASFDVESASAALENIAFLLRDWDAEEDDTTVIRIMSGVGSSE